MSKIIKIGSKKVICQSLTFGYMLDIEDEIIEESKLGIVLDGSNLSEEDARALKVTDINKIWTAIKQETYPELYNNDGSEKEFDDNESDDKKKV